MLHSMLMAAVLAAGSTPAAAAEVRVDLRGKPPAAAHQALAQAAKAACWKDLRRDPLAITLIDQCARASLARAVATANRPALTAYHASGRLGTETLAAR
jgi:hypothetical protein